MNLLFSLIVLIVLLGYIAVSYKLWKKDNTLHLDRIVAILSRYLFAIGIFMIIISFFFNFIATNIIVNGISLIISLYFLILVTSFFYNRYLNPNYSNLKVFLYYTSLLIGGGIMYAMATEMDYYDDTPMIIEAFAMTIAGLILACIPFIFVKISELFNKKSRKETINKNTPLKRTTKDMQKHYKEHGLSNSEIESFRKQMAITKNEILSIETNIQKTAKLRAIETRNNTIEVCQSFFRDIVEEPQRIGEADQFLYRFLPSLEDLVLKYNEINNHVAKNKQTYQILEKSAHTIDLVCQQITDEYIVFHKDDYNDLNDEVHLAHLNIKRRNTEINDATVDDIINEDMGGSQDDNQ